MKLPGFPLFSVLVLLIAACANSLAQTNTFVVPAGMDAAFGEEEVRPFPIGYLNFEQIYTSNAFAQLPRDTITITELAFRVDENQTSDLDRPAANLFVAMNTTRRSLEEIARWGSAYEFPRTTVYHADLKIRGRHGLTNAFDIRIPLQTAFTYDRRKGHLVVGLSRSSDEYVVLDAHWLGFGFGMYSGGGNPPSFASGNLITKFSYVIPPRISRISHSRGEVELTFDFPGPLERLRVEASATVNGPYEEVTGAVLTLNETGEGTAKLVVREKSLYIRLSQSFQ